MRGMWRRYCAYGCSWITLSVVQPLNKALIVISHSSRRRNKSSSMYK